MDAIEQLLLDVHNIVETQEKTYKETGIGYNIFFVQDTYNKEVLMCRVLADLLNPEGWHYQGRTFLNLFLKQINDEISETEYITVTPEYPTDEKRRIDIAIETETRFIPIEVKIHARDQSRQCKDYYAFSQKKLKEKVRQNKKVSLEQQVIYLTIDRHLPSEDSMTAKQNCNVLCLSWRQDILKWLENCLTKTLPEPINQVLIQYQKAIKQFCGIIGDEEMELKIEKEIVSSKETFDAAQKIQEAMDSIEEDCVTEMYKLIGDYHGLKSVKVKDSKSLKGWPKGVYFYKPGEYELSVVNLFIGWEEKCGDPFIGLAAGNPTKKLKELHKKNKELNKANDDFYYKKTLTEYKGNTYKFFSEILNQSIEKKLKRWLNELETEFNKSIEEI